MNKDTIVANATPLMPSAVSIIRLSGKDALNIAKNMINFPEEIKPRKAYFGKILDRNKETIDEGLVLYFKAPNSFTGEDVVEFQTHGSVPVVKKIINEAINFGARFAEPGEFTKRAFLNGKIDLTQAEAIAQLIDAKSEKASKVAVNILEGKLSKQINQIRTNLLNLVSLIEAEINFPEDVEEIEMSQLKEELEKVKNRIEKLMSTYKKGQIVQEGIKLAIVGKPNVGKSSLFNALIGYERAIVSDFEGTTRDFIEESLVIQGIPVKLLDTAGIRKTENKVEEIGIRKTKEVIDSADIVLFVFDSSQEITKEDLEIYETVKYKNPIVVGNKYDLALVNNFKKDYFKDIIYVSSKTSYGLKNLEEEILKRLQLLEDTDNDIFINFRHYKILEKSLEKINQLIPNIENYIDMKEILMLEIQEIESYLQEIIGEIGTEDILGNIFNNFCIGK